MKRLAWLLPALLLAGCEFEIPGQKAKDAAAMGYACRVSKKSPEQCMRENPDFSQTAILEGWREADADVKDKKVDTDFPPPPRVIIKPAGPKTSKGETKEGAEGEQPPEETVPEAASAPAVPAEAEAKPAQAHPAEPPKGK